MKIATTAKLNAPFVYVAYQRNPEKKSKLPLSRNMKTVMAAMAGGGKYEEETFAERSALEGLWARGLVECVCLEELDRQGNSKRPTADEMVLRNIFNINPFPLEISQRYWVLVSET